MSAGNVTWCKDNNVEYMPVVFPGFSWHNLMMARRQNARAVSAQIKEYMENDVTMIYQAMFDEMDEGTAIFKITNNPPAGGVSRFLDLEGLPSDFYLKLLGDAAKELKRKTAQTGRKKTELQSEDGGVKPAPGGIF